MRLAMKRLVKGLLERHGYALASPSHVPSLDRLVSLMLRYDFSPRSVFDIGVARGTPWLYDAFPDAQFYLIDPTRESLPYMKQWSTKINAKIVNVALGDFDGSTIIRTRNTIQHATMLIDVTDPQIEARYEVQVRRFDQEVPQFDMPALCKIDVEGAEVMVLRGMGSRVREFDMFIIECNLMSLYEKGVEFRDVMQLLDRNGFVVYDIVGVNRRPYDNALHQIDAVFVPSDSALRAERRWAQGDAARRRGW